MDDRFGSGRTGHPGRPEGGHVPADHEATSLAVGEAGEGMGSEEQARLDVVYARLDALRAQTATRLAEVRRAGPSGSPQNRSERDAFATLYEDRLAQLNSVEERLVFGRLYLRGGESRYVGRIGMSDEDHVPLLTDWRAPAARPFYQATAAAPGDVLRRRHLLTRARRVVGVEDEVLDLASVAAAELPTLSGEGALLAALAARRTGRMGDIVATIQAEQDAIIRDDLAGILVVQGGPGTGKTAVALHRAAFLLYAHREKLERSGVLLVGPSRVFLRYIEQVLPSLGETGVVATTIGDLLPGISATVVELPEVTEVKGRLAMARVIARAVRSRQRVPGTVQDLRVGAHVLRVRPEEVREAQAKARRSGAPHNRARVTFVRAMLNRLAVQYAELIGGSVSAEDLDDLAEEIRTSRDARVALNLAWMPLTPEGLLADLYAKPHRLAEVAPELSERDRALLFRERDAPWTTADVPLLDEAAELLGEDDSAERARGRTEAARRESEVAYARQTLAATGLGHGLVSAEMLAERFAERGPAATTAERAAADRSWTYGHVIVDEAQELSPMAWRAILRRIPARSMTIVGDLAQTSTVRRARSWGEVLDGSLRGSWRLSELTVNYRTPAAVMDVATAVARHAGLATSPIRSARVVDEAVVVTRADASGPAGWGTAALGAAAVEAVRVELAALDGGRLAVIAAPSAVGAIRGALDAAATADTGLASAVAATPGDPLSAAVVVLDPVAAKGLEFDVVVLVEPRDILGQVPGGSRAGVGRDAARVSDLYVAITRATRRLHVVHHAPLPPGMTAA
jgi:DNA helicase IV